MRNCGHCAYYCDGFCDCKGLIRDDNDNACKRYIEAQVYDCLDEDEVELLDGLEDD